MAWLCVLTYEAEQGVQSLEALPVPCDSRTCQSAHPRLQSMLRAQAKASSTLEGRRPPVPPIPTRPPAVVLKENSDWQKGTPQENPKDESPRDSARPKSGQPPPLGVTKTLKAGPGLESRPKEGGPSGPSKQRDDTPRGSREASAAELSPWGGTNWGGSSANSTWSRGSWNRQGRSWKDRSPSRPRKAASQASGSQAESEQPKQRKRPHSTRRQSKAPKYRDLSQFEAAWEGAKPEFCAVQPHATFYEDAPPHQEGVPRGKFNLSGVKVTRTTIDGERRVLLSIPAEVAGLVTQRLVVEMVAGRCRKAGAKLLEQQARGFRKKYPEVASPQHHDYEFFSFLWDRQLAYPEVWEVPPWFRQATLLAAAEEEKHLRPLAEGGYTYLVRKAPHSQEEFEDDRPPPTSPASDPAPGGAGQEDADMQDAGVKEADTE
eukprot:448888-Amphidinium_carterae.1